MTDRDVQHPKAGDVVVNIYKTPERTVTSVTPWVVRYTTITATGRTAERCCLLKTWQRWCAETRASFVETE